jgi:hypothetical protein
MARAVGICEGACFPGALPQIGMKLAFGSMDDMGNPIVPDGAGRVDLHISFIQLVAAGLREYFHDALMFFFTF